MDYGVGVGMVVSLSTAGASRVSLKPKSPRPVAEMRDVREASVGESLSSSVLSSRIAEHLHESRT